MSTAQRIGFAAIAVIIALVAAVALSSGSDEQADPADTPPTARESTATPEPQEASPAESPSATPTPKPAPKSEVVSFRDGKVVGGRARLSFKKGETARFGISSDVSDEIHVHGYDLYKDVPAGGTARFSFRADIEGIFEVELHDKALEVAQLRVEP